jgi:hypothetical protein
MFPGVKAPGICFGKTGKIWIRTREMGALSLTFYNLTLTLKLERRLLLSFLQVANKQIEILFSFNGSKNGIMSTNLVRKAAMQRAFSLLSKLRPLAFIGLESTISTNALLENGQLSGSCQF